MTPKSNYISAAIIEVHQAMPFIAEHFALSSFGVFPHLVFACRRVEEPSILPVVDEAEFAINRSSLNIRDAKTKTIICQLQSMCLDIISFNVHDGDRRTRDSPPRLSFSH